jgi:hypothetical protein
MLIDDQVRIRSLIRAMQDVIIPSIAPDAQLAIEQAHLVCRHLELMLTQADYAYRLQHAELAHFASMLRDLVACLPDEARVSADAAEVEELLRRANPIAHLAVPDGGTLSGLTKEVREAVDQTLRRALSEGGTVGGRASRLVLDYAQRQILRERVAVKTTGFDLDASSQPDLKDVT